MLIPTVWEQGAVGGSPDIELIGKSAERLACNVARCRYAEFCQEHCRHDLPIQIGYAIVSARSSL